MWQKIKNRLGVASNLQVVLILTTFSLAGSSLLYVRHGLWALLGVNDDTSTWLIVGLWILLLFPCYQVCLLSWAFVLGQFPYFWGRFQKIGRLFRRDRSPQADDTAAIEESA